MPAPLPHVTKGTWLVSQPAMTDPLTLNGERTMTRNVEKATKAKTLDDAALDKVAGGAGSRFELNIGSYSVGYPSPPVQPATKP